MQHDIDIRGFGYRLRPVVEADSEFILSLRTNATLARYVHRVTGRLEDQLAWFHSYCNREGDWYWIIERDDGTPEGTTGLYNFLESSLTVEWGRWILAPSSMGAFASAILIFKVAFEHLKVNEVYCQTLLLNRQVISFHDHFGLERKDLKKDVFEIDGRPCDAVIQAITRERWLDIEPRMEAKALRWARLWNKEGGHEPHAGKPESSGCGGAERGGKET
jgi:RimJ/RimL family protein N-acetyltransferase